MSLLSYFVAPDQAQVVTDTLSYEREGAPLTFTPKQFYLSHIGAVMAVRGSHLVGWGVCANLANTALGDFDQLLTALPAIVRHASESFVEIYGVPTIGNWGVVELSVFGWSPGRKRVAGVTFTADANGVVSQQELPDGPSFAPHPQHPSIKVRPDHPELAAVIRANQHALAKFKSPMTFVAMAKLQQIVARDYFGFALGGDLTLSEVRRDGIAIRKIFRFPEADKMLAEMRAEAPALEEAGTPEPARTAFAPGRQAHHQS